jgi:hypothetical protein
MKAETAIRDMLTLHGPLTLSTLGRELAARGLLGFGVDVGTIIAKMGGIEFDELTSEVKMADKKQQEIPVPSTVLDHECPKETALIEYIREAAVAYRRTHSDLDTAQCLGLSPGSVDTFFRRAWSVEKALRVAHAFSLQLPERLYATPFEVDRLGWYFTRHGEEVPVVCTDAPGEYPIVYRRSDHAYLTTTRDGCFSKESGDELNDLVEFIRPKDW